MNAHRNHDPVDRASLPSTENTVLAHRLRRPPRERPFLYDFVMCVGLLLAAGGALAGGLLKGFWAGVGVFVGIFLITGCVALCVSKATEPPPLAPLTSLFRSWNDVVDRLLRSENKLERNHWFLGIIEKCRDPLLLDRPHVNGHIAVFGATGRGKSMRGLFPLAMQVLRRRDSSVLVVNLKGGRAEFALMGQEAKRNRLSSRWFTTGTGLCSYVFSPFLHCIWPQLSINEKTQILMAGMGGDFGDTTSGDAYFGGAGEARLRGAFTLRPNIRSFRELAEFMREPKFAQNIGMSKRDFEASGAVQADVERLATIPQLNAEPVDGYTADVFAGAIDVEELLTTPQVAYLDLPATVEATTSRTVARLVVRMLVAAARRHGVKRTQVYVIIDEFQEIVQRSLATPIKQCRDLGISLWMSMQQAADLATGDLNFLDTILGNTSIRMFFSATDPVGRDYLTKASGEWKQTLRGTSQTITQADGRGTSIASSTQSHESIAARITQEDVNRLNATNGLCVVEATPHSGFTRLNYPAFVRVPYPISEAEFRRLQASPWPPANKFTVVHHLEPSPVVAEPTPAALASSSPQPSTPAPSGETATPSKPTAPRPRTQRARLRRVGQPSDSTPSLFVAPAATVSKRDPETNAMAAYLNQLAQDAPAAVEQ